MKQKDLNFHLLYSKEEIFKYYGQKYIISKYISLCFPPARPPSTWKEKKRKEYPLTPPVLSHGNDDDELPELTTLLVFGEAPWLISWWTMFSCPIKAATWIGVRPD